MTLELVELAAAMYRIAIRWQHYGSKIIINKSFIYNNLQDNCRYACYIKQQICYPIHLFHPIYQDYYSQTMIDSHNNLTAKLRLSTNHNSSDYNEDANLLPDELSGDENATEISLPTAVGPKANFVLTVTTIIKTVIGSAIVSMPYVINQLGWLFGTFLFITAGLLNQFWSLLLLKSKNLSRHSNYTTILFSIWKSRMAKVLGSVLIIISNIGTCILQVIILKSAVRNILVDILGPESQALNQFYTTQIFIVLVVALLEAPVILIKKIQRLRFLALTGAIGIVIFILSFMVFFIRTSSSTDPFDRPAGNMRMLPRDWFKAAAAVPNIIGALAYQTNMFPVFKGMKKPSDQKMGAAIAVSLAFCTSSYLLMGILGYYYVGDSVGANFLNSLSYQKLPTFYYCTIKLSYLLSLFFAIPLMFFGGRNNLIAVSQLLLNAHRNRQKGERLSSRSQNESSSLNAAQQNVWRQSAQQLTASQIAAKEKRSNLQFILYSVALYLAVMGISMAVSNIQAVFNLLGSICASSICIILPCFFYVKLVALRQKARTFKYYLAFGLLLVMTPYSLFSIAALYVTP